VRVHSNSSVVGRTLPLISPFGTRWPIKSRPPALNKKSTPLFPLLTPLPSPRAPRCPANHAGFRPFNDTIDGYKLFRPDDWIEVKGSGNDVFFRNGNAGSAEENMFVSISSPSSTKQGGALPRGCQIGRMSRIVNWTCFFTVHPTRVVTPGGVSDWLRRGPPY
jgi:hypothetical protein